MKLSQKETKNGVFNSTKGLIMFLKFVSFFSSMKYPNYRKSFATDYKYKVHKQNTVPSDVGAWFLGSSAQRTFFFSTFDADDNNKNTTHTIKTCRRQAFNSLQT